MPDCVKSAVRHRRSILEGSADMRRLLLLLQKLREDSGQDLIEYALLAAFISIVAVSAITNIGSQVNMWYSSYDVVIKTIPSGGS
jgi:Flp pilus assembly pilin Flp